MEQQQQQKQFVYKIDNLAEEPGGGSFRADINVDYGDTKFPNAIVRDIHIDFDDVADDAYLVFNIDNKPDFGSDYDAMVEGLAKFLMDFIAQALMQAVAPTEEEKKLTIASQ